MSRDRPLCVVRNADAPIHWKNHFAGTRMGASDDFFFAGTKRIRTFFLPAPVVLNVCRRLHRFCVEFYTRARSVLKNTHKNALIWKHAFAHVCSVLRHLANWFDANYKATNGHQSFLNISENRFFFILVGCNNDLWKKRSFYGEINIENIVFSTEIAKKPYFRHNFLDNNHVWEIMKARAV